jgi:hypothetical protein
MIILVAIVYALVSCLLMLTGYVTTARHRLHLGLSILASVLWPVSLLVVTGYVCGQRLVGLLSRHSRSSDQSESTPEPIATCVPDDIGQRIRQPLTHRAGN